MSLTTDDIALVVRQVLDAERQDKTEQFDDLVLKTIATILTSFGIDEADRQEIKLDFQHVRRSRKAYELVQKTTIRTAIGVLVTGALAAFWLGIQAIFQHK